MPGRNGGVLYPLNATQDGLGTEGIFYGNENRMTTSNQFIDTLRRRAVYANLHSINEPAGSIRGNALGLSQSYLTTTLSGLNEIDPVVGAAGGAVKIELDAGRAIVSGSFGNLSSTFNPAIAGGSHVHMAGRMPMVEYCRPLHQPWLLIA